MTLLERRLLTIALLFSLLTLGAAAARGAGWDVTWQVPVAQAATGTYYGASESLVATATTEWPQKNPNWCGVANIEAVANYTYGIANQTMPFMTGGQQRIVNDLNSAAAVSQWGTPSPTSGQAGPLVKADIARDGGTDPRAIAWGIFYESTSGGYLRVQQPGYLLPRNAIGFHNVIYHNVYPGGTFNSAAAVAGLARTLERYQLPVSVTMAHGLHSVVVSGVFANNDPISHYPADVDAVVAWDPQPGVYQPAKEVTWNNYAFNSNANMWGSAYSSNPINGVQYDPDPAVGIYVPDATHPHHWITYLTDIEPDGNARISPDYAFDENGNVMLRP